MIKKWPARVGFSGIGLTPKLLRRLMASSGQPGQHSETLPHENQGQQEGWGYSSVEHLLSKCEALDSVLRFQRK